MERVGDYLIIPADYLHWVNVHDSVAPFGNREGLHWSASGDAIEYATGSTFDICFLGQDSLWFPYTHRDEFPFLDTDQPLQMALGWTTSLPDEWDCDQFPSLGTMTTSGSRYRGSMRAVMYAGRP
jgi:hypothetical protein